MVLGLVEILVVFVGFVVEGCPVVPGFGLLGLVEVLVLVGGLVLGAPRAVGGLDFGAGQLDHTAVGLGLFGLFEVPGKVFGGFDIVVPGLVVVVVFDDGRRDGLGLEVFHLYVGVHGVGRVGLVGRPAGSRLVVEFRDGLDLGDDLVLGGVMVLGNRHDLGGDLRLFRFLFRFLGREFVVLGCGGDVFDKLFRRLVGDGFDLFAVEGGQRLGDVMLGGVVVEGHVLAGDLLAQEVGIDEGLVRGLHGLGFGGACAGGADDRADAAEFLGDGLGLRRVLGQRNLGKVRHRGEGVGGILRLELRLGGRGSGLGSGLGRVGDGRCGGGRGGGLHRRARLIPCGQLLEDDAVVLNARLDPALDLLLGDPAQHLGIRGRRLGAEVSVIRRKIPEVLRDRLHRRERIVEPFQRTGEGPVGDGQNFARAHHQSFAFSPDPATVCLPRHPTQIRTQLRNCRDFFWSRMWQVSMKSPIRP